MQQSAIKAYDVRGVVGTDFQTQDTYFFVRALLDFLQKEHTQPIIKIFIGYDNRATSEDIKKYVISACADFGVSEIIVANVPTPVLQYALYKDYADVGIMITASHNPIEYNGLKIWYKKQAVQGILLQQIWQYMRTQQYYMPVAKKEISVQSADAIIAQYLTFLQSQFFSLHAMSFSVLCMVSGGPVQRLLEHCKQIFAWERVDIVGCKDNKACMIFSPDPISHESQQFITQQRLRKKYDCVLAFDGDADRFVVYTEQGTILSGDELGFLCIIQNQYERVVMDIKTSGGLVHVLEQKNIHVTLAPTGCAAIKETIAERNAQFGCEVSGHYFFAQHDFIDDGLFAALTFLQAAVQLGSVRTLCDQVPSLHDVPELRLPLLIPFDRDVVKNYVQEFCVPVHAGVISLVDGIRYQTEKGWFMMRASKTEPVLSLRFGVFDVHYKLEWIKIVKECIQPFIKQADIKYNE